MNSMVVKEALCQAYGWSQLELKQAEPGMTACGGPS